VTLAPLLGSVALCALILPLAWKWQLGLRKVASGLAVLTLLAWLLAATADEAVGVSTSMQAGLGGAGTALGAVSLLAYRFYRDPEREPPAGDHLVVSPADGQIVYVRRSQNGRLPVSTKHGRDMPIEELTRTNVLDSEAVIVGIGMSLLDVHVNRAPVAGTVRLHRHFAGSFGSLRRPEMVFANERATTVIDGHRTQIAVVQIASRLVRQIVTHVHEGQAVEAGQRIGVIRFGSQVDVVLRSHPDVHILVKPRDRVQAGTSVIAVIGANHQPPRAQGGR
jgi:phosphatidylserine decarboxylase